MKIAVTSQGDSLESPVDPRFGRAANFLIVDTDDGSFSVVSNEQNLQAAQGAGVQASQTVASQDVGALVTGHCGPKAFRGLEAAGVKVFSGADGMTVRDAVEAFKKGKLDETGAADVEGHWV